MSSAETYALFMAAWCALVVLIACVFWPVIRGRLR